jgi:YD repeat-containing protein
MTAITLGYDCGQGNGKLVGPHGWAMLESYTSIARPDRPATDLGGIQSRRAQRTITFSNGQAFFVGRNAHAAGDPIEALDYDRYTGAPEQRALFYGILSAYADKHQVELTKVRLTIGVPLPVLSGTGALETVSAIQAWLSGEHIWMSNGKVYHVTIMDVQLKSQAAGALYSYMYDGEGRVVKEHKNKLIVAKAGAAPQFVPFAILSLGFLTMEAMAVQYERTETGMELVKDDRFTTSLPVGIHRLLDLARPGPGYLSRTGPTTTRRVARHLECDGDLPARCLECLDRGVGTRWLETLWHHPRGGWGSRNLGQLVDPTL